MSFHKSLFSKSVCKKPKLDNEEKQGDTTLGSSTNSGASTSARKPAFNPALLNSAFYTGPVSYGGAGICATDSPYNQYSTSRFYDKKKIDVKVIPSKIEAPVGKIAKTICECLESYSSPISDAKRVPINNRPPLGSHGKTFNNLSMFDTTRRSSLLNESLTPNRYHRSRELQIPSIATLSKIKKTNRCSNVRAAIMASMSSSLPCEPQTYKLRSEEDSSTYKSKMKTKINTVRGPKSDEEEMAQPVHLQNISLNITSLPTFNDTPFTIAAPVKYSALDKKDSSSPVSTVSSRVAPENNFKFTSPLHIKATETSKTSTKFSFSDPVDIFNPKHIEQLAKSEMQKVESSPKISHKEADAESKDTAASGNLMFSKPEIPVMFKAGDYKFSPKLKENTSTETWNGIDSKKKAPEKSRLVNGDISHSDSGKRSHSDLANESNLVDSDENANIKKIKSDSPAKISNSLESFIQKQQQQWECLSCMTRNDQNKDKCVCCEASKPGASATKTATSTSSFSGFEGFMKKQQAQWECSSCMTRNDQSKDKCVCCEAAKPGAVSLPHTSTPASSFSGFDNFIKKQQAQWECNSCMTRNDQNKDKCLCCEAPRPGAVSSSTGGDLKNSATNNTAATSPPFSGFANFIKKQQEQWECPCCMTRNDHNRNKCACCEAAKVGSEPPVSAANNFNFGNPQNTFKFGIDKAAESAKTETDPKVSDVKPADKIPTFSFGSQSSTDNKTGNGTIGGFKFGVPTTTTSTADTSVSSKPTFSFGEKKEGSTVAVGASTGGFSFGVKSTESTTLTSTTLVTSDSKPSGFTFGAVQKDNETEKLKVNAVPKVDSAKDVVQTTTQKEDSTAATVTSSQSLFTFGSQAKTEFSSKPFQFGSPASKPPSSNTETFIPPKPFMFGQNTAENKADPAVKPVFQLPTTNATSLFSASNVASSQGTDAKPSSVQVGSQFSTSSTTENKPKDQAPPSYFTFGSAASSAAPSSTGSFKSPTPNVPSMTFGSTDTPKCDAPNMFSSSVTTSAPATLFGVKSSTDQALSTPSASLFKPQLTTTPTFGSSSTTNIFKPSTETAPPVFGSSALSQPASKPANLFGSPSLTAEPNANARPNQTMSSPFSNPNVPTFGAGNIFGSAAAANTVSSGNMFGTSINKPSENSGGMFNAQPAPATNIFGSSIAPATSPPQAANAIFGSSPSVPTPVFGASIPFGETSQNQSQQNAPFKFGSQSSSQPPAMGFGQAPAAGSSAPVFSFGSGSAAPPSNSQFDFSMGTPSSSAFSAPGLPAARRFKKAVRRSNVR